VHPLPRNGRARRRLRRKARFLRRRFTAVAAAVLALAAVAGAGLAGAAPSPDTRIDSAQSEADQLSQRIEEQATEIADLEQRAREAGAREMVLTAEIERTAARSRELAAELAAAEARLDAVQARYRQALDSLSARLVEIYKGTAPDGLTLLLDSNGYDDLSTRAEYLDALHDADARLAGQVASLKEEVRGDLEEIAGLKAEIDEQEAASGTPAYSGGPYAIPTYIVICESGGNYHALNPSTGAGGAYQILPSTWRAYGGQGLPHEAPTAEQDRIAAMIWADSGPSAWACA
jgi:septal ring factor EnvC (AmiA/AmiB activator)